jgi:GT2 family glycosyltransferase
MNIYRAILRSRFLEVGGFDPIAGYEDDSTLYPKLGVMARYAPGAICYHNNPGTLREIVESARWIGRSIRFTRPRKVIRFTLPFSFLYAVVQSIRYRMPRFFIFKLIHDVGILAGWLSRLLLKEYKK